MESAVNKVCGGVELVSDRRATRKRGTQKNRRLIAQVLKLGFIVLQRVIPYTISNTGRSPSKVKPGWNDYCKEKRDIAMYWHEE